MHELAKEYKMSLQALTKRINELSKEKEETELELKEINRAMRVNLEDVESKECSIYEINERIRPLRNMQTELRKLAAEVKNYYETWWYRSPAYTFNPGRTREHILPGFVYFETGNKSRRKGGNAKTNSSVDGGINRKTKTSD